MRFVVLFIPSFSDRPAGALTTISSSSQSCVIAKPLLFADELPASGGTPKHLSLLPYLVRASPVSSPTEDVPPLLGKKGESGESVRKEGPFCPFRPPSSFHHSLAFVHPASSPSLATSLRCRAWTQFSRIQTLPRSFLGLPPSAMFSFLLITTSPLNGTVLGSHVSHQFYSPPPTMKAAVLPIRASRLLMAEPPQLPVLHLSSPPCFLASPSPC